MNATETQRLAKGRVERRTEKSAQIEGRWFAFSKSATPYIPAQGEAVVIQYHSFPGRDGKDINMVDDWSRDMSAPPAPSNTAGTAAGNPDPRFRSPAELTRLECLRAAVDTYNGWWKSKPQDADPARYPDAPEEAFILGMAERYVAWVTWGGHDSSEV